MTVDSVLRLADLRLLAAKAAGRDRAIIECAADDSVTSAPPAGAIAVPAAATTA